MTEKLGVPQAEADCSLDFSQYLQFFEIKSPTYNGLTLIEYSVA